MEFSEILKLKDDVCIMCMDILYTTVLLKHTGVSNCFYYVVTIALSVKKIV